MLTRQKIILSLLAQAGKPLLSTVFVKLVFLLRRETGLAKHQSFYDFVPYRYGPFSFSLYRELEILKQDSYVEWDSGRVGQEARKDKRIRLHGKVRHLVEQKTGELPTSAREAVAFVVDRYGQQDRRTLVQHVYDKYPWYASYAQSSGGQCVPVHSPDPAVYTIGYAGKSVDAFFDKLLSQGLKVVVDIRATPFSRKYGFSRTRLKDIAATLGLEYWHEGCLGIPGHLRTDLIDPASYRRLFREYKRHSLPRLTEEINRVALLMREQPAVLVCVEQDPQCCHRNPLAEAVSRENDLEIVHL